MRCAGGNVEDDYGYLEIRLDGLLKEKGLSKNKLSHKSEMNWKQIDNYCTNSITRVCLKIALCQPCVTVGGRFVPHEGAVAGCSNRIRSKCAAKWGVRLA